MIAKFKKYFVNSNVTNLDYNGKDIWITTKNGERYRVEDKIEEQLIDGFLQEVKILSDNEWGTMNPLQEVMIDGLVIVILHSSVTVDCSMNIVITKSNM
ncbi:MAG: hypothetical protein U0L79_07725 [Lachnospiraceae bacterium]|nr:hypothetical protein [Lachnospiraceae bacterium]